jgi:glycosyltransferase involved in cell wall biosynthesis
MNTAPVSVVIPTYNSGHLVTQAIESALSQGLPPREILVVDDGSTDDTARRVSVYPHVRYLPQPNQGVSAARNTGVRAASQEFVAFLDADDVWHPCKLELQMEVFERHPELGIVGAHQFDWPASSFPEIATHSPRLEFVTWSDLVVKNRLHTSSLVVRREVLRQAGEFDTAIQGPEDRDLWLRVVEFAPVCNLELPLLGYRDVPGSVSKQAARCKAGMLRILQKIDERNVWRGRWLLRRKAYSYVYHSCAYIYGAGELYREALRCSLLSLAWYPLPYLGSERGMSFERPKRFFVNLARWLGLKRLDKTTAALTVGRAES